MDDQVYCHIHECIHHKPECQPLKTGTQLADESIQNISDVLSTVPVIPIPADVVQETISSTWDSAFVAGIDACIAKAEEGVTPAWLIVELKQMKAERLKDYEIK